MSKKIRALIIGASWLLLCLVLFYAAFLFFCYISAVRYEHAARSHRFQFAVSIRSESNEKETYIEALLPKGKYRLILAVPKTNNDCTGKIRTEIRDLGKNVTIDTAEIDLREKDFVAVSETKYYYHRDFSTERGETLCSLTIDRDNVSCEANIVLYITTYDPFYKGDIPVVAN